MTEEPKPKRKWIWVVVGVLFVVCVLAIGGLIFAVTFFRQNMTMTPMSEQAAASEFDAIRARFPGQPPLIQLVDGRPEYTPERAARASSAVPLKTMHVVAWDDNEGQLVTFALPFWLLRLKSGPIQLSAYSQGWNDRGVSFSVEDLEKHGPGLLLDLSEAREGRLIVWVE
jgi:hypothetical protein